MSPSLWGSVRLRDRRRSLSLVIAVALPCLGLIELGLHLFFAARPPKPEDWIEARPRLEAIRQPGDLLLIAPHWIEPHARAGLGESLLPLRDLARPDESRYSRALVIRALGEQAPEVNNWKIEREESLGDKLQLQIRTNPTPVHILRDLVDEVDLGQAEGEWIVNTIASPCPRRERQRIVATGLFSHPTLPSRRYVCGAHPWQSIAVTVQDDEHFRPRRCIWMPPPQDGFARLRFHAGPLGRILRGHSGIHWTL